MINEKKLIEEMNKTFPDRFLNDKNWFMGKCSFMDLFQEIIEQMPKVGEWIPCIERLPEDETLLYWTTHEDGSLVLHGYKKSNGFIYNWEVDDLEKRKRQGQVIAWIPIFEPAPYNAERDGKNESR